MRRADRDGLLRRCQPDQRLVRASSGFPQLPRRPHPQLAAARRAFLWVESGCGAVAVGRVPSHRAGHADFPASGSRTRPHAFAHGRSRPSRVRRTSGQDRRGTLHNRSASCCRPRRRCKFALAFYGQVSVVDGQFFGDERVNGFQGLSGCFGLSWMSASAQTQDQVRARRVGWHHAPSG